MKLPVQCPPNSREEGNVKRVSGLSIYSRATGGTAVSAGSTCGRGASWNMVVLASDKGCHRQLHPMELEVERN